MEKHPTPLQSIRAWCLGCVESAAEVRTCGGERALNGGTDKRGRCLFFPYRLGRGRPSVKLIRKFCLWCMGGDAEPVRASSRVAECPEPDCPLHPFRLGKNPNIKTGWRGPAELARKTTPMRADGRSSDDLIATDTQARVEVQNA